MQGNEPSEAYGGTVGPVTVTDSATTQPLYINTRGRAVVTVDVRNSGSVALSGLTVERRVWVGGPWHVLNESAGSYATADPQRLAYAHDPLVTGYVDKDPTILPAGESVRIIIPADGHSAIRLVPLVAAGTTTLEGFYSVGD